MSRRIAGFWRLLHPLPSLMTVIAAGAFALLAARGIPPFSRFLAAMLVELAMQFSISAWNDYFDRDVDAGRADKPVPAGLVTPRGAALAGTLCGIVAVLLSAFLGRPVFILTAIGLGGGLLYDAGLKYTAFSWLPFVVAFPTLPLWAWAVARPGEPFPASVLTSAAVVAVLVTGIHLADTIPDLATDTAAGVRGLAHRLGLRRALLVCWGTFLAAALLTLLFMLVLPVRLEWYLPGLALGLGSIVVAILLYRQDPGRVKVMALLLEVGGMLIAIGWLAGASL